jgi:hypothetical protein
MSITVEEIWNDLLVRSGRFILEPSNVKLDQQRLVSLVENALRYFSKYCPKTEHFSLTLSGSSGAFFTFTDDFAVNGKTVGVPYMIVDAVPLQLLGSTNLALLGMFKSLYQKNIINTTFHIEKCPFPVAYREPTLYVPLTGDYDVTAAFVHKVVKVEGEGEQAGCLTWEVPNIEKCDPQFTNFFELLYGMFLVGVGRSQRAFTLEDLPIRTDADTLVSEGLQIEEKARQDIIENDHAFYLAWT